MKPMPTPKPKKKLSAEAAANIRAKAARLVAGACLFLFAVCSAHAAVQTIQVTIGASATQVSTTPVYCKWVVFQDNTAANTMRLGDPAVTSSRGIKLAAGGSFFAPVKNDGQVTSLQNWYVAGTQNDVLDVVCDVVTFQ